MTIGHDDEVRRERFSALYRKYYRRVVRYFESAFHVSREDAEDLAEDAFLRFYNAMDEYRGDAEWAFLEKVALHVGLNRIRSLSAAKRKMRMVDLDDPGFRQEPAAPEEPGYAERQEAALLRRALRDAILQLPDGQRECVRLWLQNLKYEEIAGALGITVDAVKSRLRDAKKQLRAILGSDRGDPLPEDES